MVSYNDLLLRVLVHKHAHNLALIKKKPQNILRVVIYRYVCNNIRKKSVNWTIKSGFSKPCGRKFGWQQWRKREKYDHYTKKYTSRNVGRGSPNVLLQCISLLIICYKRALNHSLFIWLVLITTKIKSASVIFGFKIWDIDDGWRHRCCESVYSSMLFVIKSQLIQCL